MTSEQEDRIERLAETAGRVHVRPPYSDGSIEVATPGGACWLMSPGGCLTERPFSHSIDWRY